MTPPIESLVIGAMVGAVFGVALAASRWFVALVFSVAAIAIALILVDHGLTGIEMYGRWLLTEVRQHGVLLFGTALGLIGVGTFMSSSS